MKKWTEASIIEDKVHVSYVAKSHALTCNVQLYNKKFTANLIWDLHNLRIQNESIFVDIRENLFCRFQGFGVYFFCQLVTNVISNVLRPESIKLDSLVLTSLPPYTAITVLNFPAEGILKCAVCINPP